MTISLERDLAAGACVVRLDGELDLAVVPELREALTSVIETGCDHVVFDLQQVVYVDSTALGLVVWLDRQLAPNEGRVVLAGANADVTRIFELSGLVGVAPTISARESVDDALLGLAPPSRSDAMRWSESILVPAQAESLADVRRTVCDLLGTLGMSEPTVFDIKVAVGEALANAVRHGSPGGESDQIRVDVSAYADRVVIQVRDRGGGFEGISKGAAGEDYLFAAGGRGVLFMRALMDSVEFARDPSTGGTVVTLVKRLVVRHADQGESDSKGGKDT